MAARGSGRPRSARRSDGVAETRPKADRQRAGGDLPRVSCCREWQASAAGSGRSRAKGRRTRHSAVPSRPWSARETGPGAETAGRCVQCHRAPAVLPALAIGVADSAVVTGHDPMIADGGAEHVRSQVAQRRAAVAGRSAGHDVMHMRMVIQRPSLGRVTRRRSSGTLTRLEPACRAAAYLNKRLQPSGGSGRS